MKREIGQSVVFVDKHGEPRPALVTAWWHGKPEDSDTSASANLVIVSNDGARTDKYGRQTEHETSVVHKSAQTAPGMYWCWPDEVGF